MTSSHLISRIFRITGLAAGAFVTAKFISNSLNRFSLENRVVLITGGSRGLGLVIARMAAEEGAKVIICGRSEEQLREASRDLSAISHEHLAIPCDISDKQQVEDLIQKCKAEAGMVDVIINNAGIVQVGPMETMDRDDFEIAMNTHFWGPYNVIQQVLPDMIARNTGRIVNIVSIGGKVSFPHLLPYNTSKFALSGYSEGMAAELDNTDVKVTTVYPGLMRTGSPRNIDVKGQHEKEYAWFKISDSLPLISISAERAAGKILDVMKKGEKTLTLTVPAKLAVALHGVAPGLTMTFFDLINHLLPDSTDDKDVKKGYESRSTLSESFLARKTDKAAEKNLEK